MPGVARLRALLAGARDAGKRAPLRDDRCKHDEAPSARALQGPGRDAPLGSWAQAVALSDVSPQQITACDRPIEAALQPCADRRAGQP